jgi:hypothetical protein
VLRPSRRTGTLCCLAPGNRLVGPTHPTQTGGHAHSEYVYIYRSGTGNIFKIGKATDVAKRVRAHTTGNPEPLTEFAIIETEEASKCETYLHHRLRSRRSTRSSATEFFEVDPDELPVLIEDARHYVRELLPAFAEAERLGDAWCDDRVLVPSEDVLATYRELLEVCETHDTLGFQREFLKARLKIAVGTASGIERVADWRAVTRQRLDGELLRRDRRDIYDKYQRQTRFRRFNLL